MSTMAALVQTYPQQTTTVTMLQTRPTSASGMLPSSSQSQANQQYMTSPNHQHRNSFHGLPGPAGTPVLYRGSTVPIQPYAFTTTPSLSPAAQWQQAGTPRTASSPAVPSQNFTGHHGARSRYPASVSMTNLPTTSTLGSADGSSHDDLSLMVTARGTAQIARPHSAYMTGSSGQPGFTQTAPTRAAPERYRRPARLTEPSNTGNSDQRAGAARNLHPSMANNRPNSVYSSASGSSADDAQIHRHPSSEEAKITRQRGTHNQEPSDYSTSVTIRSGKIPDQAPRLGELAFQKSAEKDVMTTRVGGLNANSEQKANSRNGSSESLASSRSNNSRPSSANRNTTAPTPAGNPASNSAPEQNSSNHDQPRLVTIPPRSSSSDAAKRLNPSPLSKPVTMDTDQNLGQQSTPAKDGPVSVARPMPSPANRGQPESPAARQLAALNAKGGKPKSKTSRLRRAFSFGSAAEFRKAAGPEIGESTEGNQEPQRLHKDPTADELYDAEQARIAQKQEASGLGNSIYGGKIFTGSTDNLSISSTASSASIMIRKMGRGVKRTSRSLAGLFRPKSIIGTPTDEAPVPDTTQAAVSMVTVEADRVNVNADPRSQQGGGTGFPRLERNSLDAANAPSLPSLTSERLGSSGTDNSARKSIVGGEKERAEALAAVRKGILKHTMSGSPSPSPKPAETIPSVPAISDSPNSSAPSTPNDESQGHRRAGSVAIGGEDYFMTALRLRQDTKSAPGTPNLGTPHSTLKRNATFSPRIVFHDTWPSQEYDRRGEIATCNRLTPMLAQQIKEELNNFKMEMEVHENSKIYTHFF